MTAEARGLQGLTSGFMGGAEFYNKKIEDFNADIAELEYKEVAGGGLTAPEQTKLITTRKLRSDAEKNKNIQQRAINTVADIYSTSDRGYLETKDDERTSASYRLMNYLQEDRPRTNKVSEFIGAAAVTSQVSQDLNTVMQEGVEQGNFGKVRRAVINSAEINKNMTNKFVETLQDVDFGDTNQVQTVLQAEMGRLDSLVAPLGDERGMELFKELNQGSLIQQKMFAQVRSSMATTKGERNLYSTLEMATGRKLAEIGIEDPYEMIGTTKEEYFAQKGVQLPEQQVSETTMGKLQDLGIDDLGSLNEEISRTSFMGKEFTKTRMDVARESGKFSKEELNQLESSKDSAEKVKSTEEDFNTMQINAFKGFASAISDNEGTYKKIEEQQAVYEAADLSKLSKGKRLELEYAMERRDEAAEDMRGEKLTALAKEKFGADIELPDLSDTQITELMKDESAAQAFESMRSASSEFEKSSLALGRTFEATSQSVEKKFAFSIERAGAAVQNFSAGLTTAGDFSTKTMAFVNTLKDSVQTMALTGEGKKFAAAEGLEEMKKDEMAKLAFDLTGVEKIEDLSRVDEEGLTGIDRLRQMGTLTDDQFNQVSALRSEYEAGEKDVLKSRTMGLQAAEQSAQLAFQASSVGSKEFQNVTSTMLGTNWQQRQRLRESSSKELRTALEGYEAAETPEEKRKFSTFIDSNIAAQRKLGLNDYQIRAGVAQFAGGDFNAYDRVASKRVDALVSKTNSDVMLSLLSGADVKTTEDTAGLSASEKMEYAKLETPEERKKYLTESKGYGAISGAGKEATFNEAHSRFMGEAVIDASNKASGEVVSQAMPDNLSTEIGNEVGAEISGGAAAAPVVENMTEAVSQTMDTRQFDSAVNNFRQASSNQIDSVSKQTEMASATVSSATIDSEASQRATQQQPITIDTQQTDIGDRTLDGAAAASNTAALEGLLNKTPSISTPANEESFILMP